MVVLHFMELFEPVFARGPDFRNYILLIAYHLLEICLGSIIILVWLHVLGFSSHRITSDFNDPVLLACVRALAMVGTCDEHG